MNYKVIIREIEYVNRVVYVEAESAEEAANFRSDAHGTFTLPSLLAALELQHQKNEIDALAKTIEGADLLRDHPSVVWSCSRCSEFGGWIANGNLGFAHGNFLYASIACIPAIVYDSII